MHTRHHKNLKFCCIKIQLSWIEIIFREYLMVLDEVSRLLKKLVRRNQEKCSLIVGAFQKKNCPTIRNDLILSVRLTAEGSTLLSFCKTIKKIHPKHKSKCYKKSLFLITEGIFTKYKIFVIRMGAFARTLNLFKKPKNS